MLCVVPPGVMPSREKLENSALNNPHGYGFAIVIPEENRILRERTMNADESINRFLELRSYYPNGYAMWHARYATHGSRTVENCHPFIVGNDQRTYLAHNGMLPVTIAKQDDRSDTRVFAEEMLPAIGGISSLDNDYIFEMLEDYCVSSKVAILTVDPAAKHQMYLLNANAGNEDETGVWWSNDSCYLNYGYADPHKKTKGVSTWLDGADDLDDVYECPNCDSMHEYDLITSADYTCPSCGWCFDCLSSFNDCLCKYTSSGKVSVGRSDYADYTPVNWKQTGWASKDWDY
jgi:predicted glutamine amidotransferase